MRQKQGKIGCSIQAVLKFVSASARFWERGARCTVGRFTSGRDKAAAFFGGKDDLGINLQERDTIILYAVRMVVNSFFPAVAGSKCHAIESGSRLLNIRGDLVTKRNGAKLDGNSAKRLVESVIWSR